MKVTQAILWLVFLFLAGRQLQLWQNQELLVEAGKRFQSSLTKVARIPLAKPSFQLKPSVTASTKATPIRAIHRNWPRQKRMALPLDLPITKFDGQKSWTYRSKHFEFVSNAPLRDHVVREFAALFELTHLYCNHLPFGLERLQNGRDENLQVRLIENYSHYIREGGAPGSGGIYLTDPDLILVPFEGLGLKKKKQ